ncbi:hypothetical protein HanXRQr2_Chr15g0697241 [Helianthus annuus]|uniref:Uncharacterized protein n=1 Tax=Helianthus annuus TaxID=4232 RepID=A0A9K3H4X4_HELAN|nr:hypothetical protein HanXRQr2_Chr15g0697241 [Helianthus annuus]KAJ0831611.1 hypothetical protein HanPSC8_Chr15g0669011 [Helianthus annuus]
MVVAASSQLNHQASLYSPLMELAGDFRFSALCLPVNSGSMLLYHHWKFRFPDC